MRNCLLDSFGSPFGSQRRNYDDTHAPDPQAGQPTRPHPVVAH
jgi:hypothetical protein